MLQSIKATRPFIVIIQFIKFCFVGLLNTLVDVGALNLLMWLTGVYKGRWIFLLNVVSFSLAVTNSYFWNKYWTFRARETTQPISEFFQFLLISVIGVLINSSIVYGVTTFTSPFAGWGEEIWANFAKLLAIGVSMIWNFLGYKFIVFKKKD